MNNRVSPSGDEGFAFHFLFIFYLIFGFIFVSLIGDSIDSRCSTKCLPRRDFCHNSPSFQKLVGRMFVQPAGFLEVSSLFLCIRFFFSSRSMHVHIILTDVQSCVFRVLSGCIMLKLRSGFEDNMSAFDMHE